MTPQASRTYAYGVDSGQVGAKLLARAGEKVVEENQVRIVVGHGREIPIAQRVAAGLIGETAGPRSHHNRAQRIRNKLARKRVDHSFRSSEMAVEHEYHRRPAGRIRQKQPEPPRKSSRHDHIIALGKLGTDPVGI